MRNNMNSMGGMGGMSGYPTMNPMNNENDQAMNMKNALMPSMHSPMDGSGMITEIAPKKRGRKKKVREEER